MRIVLPLFLAASLFAQTEANVPPVKPLQVPVRIGVLDSVHITLSEVIQRVLENDRDLEVSRIARDEANYNITSAKGYYDPRLGFNANRNRSVTPQTSVISGAASGKLTQKQLYADPSISGISPYLGGTYRLDFAQSRVSSDSTFIGLNPQFPTALTLNLTQPLWRGMLYDDNRYRLEVARKNLTLTGEQFRQRVIEIVTQAIESYWELDFAYRNLEVQVQAVRLAEQQDASNRRQVQQGLLAPVDVVQTQTQIATFQQSVFTAQQALTQAENNLKQLITAGRADMLWGAALTPEQRPDPQIILPGVEEATKLALANRPEIAQNTVAQAVNQLDVKLSRERAKPQIDAVATLSAAGLAGRQVPVVANPFSNLFGNLGSLPPVYFGGYSQSLSNLATGSYPTVTLGVQMSLPIRNRTANAAAEVSAAETRRLKAQQAQVEMLVESDVRNTLQGVASSQARLDAAIDARKYADDQYASEQRQFQAGTSSVFLVLQRQTELTAARSREIRARADLGRAVSELDRATARTIESQSIQIR